MVHCSFVKSWGKNNVESEAYRELDRLNEGKSTRRATQFQDLDLVFGAPKLSI